MIERDGYRALHAQGDLRAARERSATRCAAACSRTRGLARLGGLNLTRRRAQAGRADHHHRLRHQLARGADRRVHARGAGPHPGRGRVRLRVPLPQPARGPTGRWSSAISQSGETADTLAAIREAKRRGARTLGLVNVVGSTIAREADGGIYLHAGPEIGVAQHQGVHQPGGRAGAAGAAPRPAAATCQHPAGPRSSSQALRQLPEQIAADPRPRRARSRRSPTRSSGPRRTPSTSAAAYNFPVALEGALKLKEISYIHAEGYPAAEMKHGPIALIDENMPVVFIAPRDAVHSKIVSQHRGGEGARREGHRADQRGRHRDRAPGRRHVHDSRRRSTC